MEDNYVSNNGGNAHRPRFHELVKLDLEDMFTSSVLEDDLGLVARLVTLDLPSGSSSNDPNAQVTRGFGEDRGLAMRKIEQPIYSHELEDDLTSSLRGQQRLACPQKLR